MRSTEYEDKIRIYRGMKIATKEVQKECLIITIAKFDYFDSLFQIVLCLLHTQEVSKKVFVFEFSDSFRNGRVAN